MIENTRDLQIERRAHALWLTIDRPAHNNALTVDLATAATAAIDSVDDDIRAIVITGSGAMFCPGADPAMAAEALAGGPAKVAEMIYGPLHGWVKSIGRAPVPVIAALNGPALGGGLDLALACDFRIAHESAFLQSSWVGLGLVTGMGGSFAAAKLAGSARAAEFILLGEPIPAARALEWGLLNAVTDHLGETVSAWVDRLARLPRHGVTANKRALRRQRDAGLEEELQLLGQEQSQLITSPLFLETVRALRDR
jgi:2-(1,2-epoxy-1,2-dihydrophenyl)acetyl-CoA isomerase